MAETGDDRLSECYWTAAAKHADIVLPITHRLSAMT